MRALLSTNLIYKGADAHWPDEWPLGLLFAKSFWCLVAVQHLFQFTHRQQSFLVVIPTVERCSSLFSTVIGLCSRFFWGFEWKWEIAFDHQTQLSLIQPMDQEVISSFNRFGQTIGATSGDFVIVSAKVWKLLKASWQKEAVICSVAETYYTTNNFAGFKVDMNWVYLNVGGLTLLLGRF